METKLKDIKTDMSTLISFAFLINHVNITISVLSPRLLHVILKLSNKSKLIYFTFNSYMQAENAYHSFIFLLILFKNAR